MTAGLPGGSSNQAINYANFDIFSETLLASALAPEFELAIIIFRESHHGTMLGMTRFRDLVDLYIVGYGWSSLVYDRLLGFHASLSGHTLNFLSRGTYFSAEQRQDGAISHGILDKRYRNDCGVIGEDCSLDMISTIASAYWIRWSKRTEMMLLCTLLVVRHGDSSSRTSPSVSMKHRRALARSRTRCKRRRVVRQAQ